MRRGIETGLKRMFEKKGYAVIGAGGSRYVLAGNRRSIYIVLPKRTRRKRVTIPERDQISHRDRREVLRPSGDSGEVRPQEVVLKEISRPERVTVSIDEESSLAFK